MQTKYAVATALGLTVLGGLLAGCAKTSESADARSPSHCRAIAADAFGAAKSDAKWIAADSASKTPAFCEVTATLSPEPDSSIGVVYRLPEDWNGKVLGLGGGGWAGNVTLEAAQPGLAAHYATAQTDGGHPGTGIWDNGWTADAAKATDFSWRAVHEMTVAAKKLVAAYYGKAHDRAYFQGCSTGGRQALMEAQRFPADYNGIVAGAPVYSLQVQSSAVLRNNLFAAPGAGLSEADIKLVNDAVLAACDMKDGVKDGIIADPRSCRWNPAVLQCKAGNSGACLSSAQVKALQTAYAGVRAPDESWAQFPLSRGGEAGWGMFIAVGGGKEASNGGGMMGLAPVIFPGRKVDFAALTPREVMEARSSDFAKMYEATDPDLSDFFANGGKLLLWHGESDPGPSPVGTIDYGQDVTQADPVRAADSFRMFLDPGVGHCRGGPGTDKIDTLAALDDWLASGTAPDTLIARREDETMTRPLCAWPRIARYAREGDPDDPANYSCVDRD